MLVRGASPRRRWNTKGEIEEVEVADLMPKLKCLLSVTKRLNKAFGELALLSAISKNADGTYALNTDIADRVHKALPVAHLSFWRRQALLVLLKSIPWKNVEPR